jgi:hypothetical protein
MLLDYEALQLKTFLPGATVLYDGGQFEIADRLEDRRPYLLRFCTSGIFERQN